MKIALIVPGGVDRSESVFVIPVLLALIERLARKHQVIVISLDSREQPSEYELLGARVVTLGRTEGRNRVSRTAVILGKLMSALHKAGGGFDLLHAFWASPQGTLAIGAGTLLRIPVVVSIGGGELVWMPTIRYGGMGTVLTRITMAMTLRMADAVSAPSKYAIRFAKEIRPDVHWLPTGVDTIKYQGSLQRPSDGPSRLLHVAGLNEVKNQETLLQAIHQVAKANRQIVLDCVGVDTLNGRTQALARDLGIADIVRFHGVLPTDEIVPFYCNAHLFVQSSLYESMGAAVLEAAACGVPTVGTNVGIVAEMSPEAALAVPVQDPSALAGGIIEMLGNPLKRESLAQAAQKFARTYNADWTVAQLENIYRKVVQH